MDIRFRLIGQKRRDASRAFAREAFITDPDTAKEVAEQSIRAEFGGILTSIFIGIMVRLAVELILHWLQSDLTGAPKWQWQEGEPGYGK